MAACWAGLVYPASAQEKVNVPVLRAELDSVRAALRIPGMAVALRQGDAVLLETGLGYADLENRVKATAATSFRVASITKTFTSTLLMQLVEQGKLSLDAPISAYAVDLGDPRITVRHLLTHTSEGEPGTHFQYNGYRYGRLGPVMEKAAGKPFYELLMENIVLPLRLRSTAPGLSLPSYFDYIQRRKAVRPYFNNAFRYLAKPYELNARGEVVPTQYLNEFGAFGGLTTTVGDLLRYSTALDQHRFVTAATQQQIFTPNRTRTGVATPYGLGWYTQTYQGLDLYWHYGQTPGESGLLVKVPARQLTFVVLANTDKLSQPFPLGDGDLFTSPLGQLLYKYVLNADAGFAAVNYHRPVAAIEAELAAAGPGPHRAFYNRELITQAALALVGQDTVRAQQFYAAYGRLNFHSVPTAGPAGDVLAAIWQVGINRTLTQDFSLPAPARIRVEGVGENCSGDFSSWCDYGAIEDTAGKVVWQMPGQPARHAGGAQKNQRVSQVITLPAGRYRLRYTSDGGHAFNRWDSAPPEGFLWGIGLYREPTGTSR